MPEETKKKQKPAPMNEIRAKEILSHPLVFGDPEQIAAKNYLDELQEERDRAADLEN